MNRFELPRDLDAERRSATVRVWAMRAEAQKILLRAFSARGVPIVAGSRATDELMVPGFSLHDELKTLHESGLTTAEALRAATLAPAAAMGLASGAIEVGRPADLVLLRANPLVDIDNMRSIDVVIRAGRVHDRTALDAMLEAVRQAHAISRRFELTRYQ
jgi:imidazolonepropionase-like amidohydrolase